MQRWILSCAALTITLFIGTAPSDARDPDQDRNQNPFQAVTKQPISKSTFRHVAHQAQTDKALQEKQKVSEVLLFASAAAANTQAGAQSKPAHNSKEIAHDKKQQPNDRPPYTPRQNGANQAPFVKGHYVLTGNFPVNGYRKGSPVVVIVDKSSHFTHVLQLQNQKIVRVLTVSNAVGTGDRPTPPGPYFVTRKKMYPRWLPPVTIDPKQKLVPPYNQTHKNPLGVASIYLNKFEIDLHGTNEPNMIRKSVSHGCIRHSNPDILKLFAIVNPGDRVYIVNKFRGKVLNRFDFVRQKHSH